jgi:glycosyltransferase involved in cell wall biosynthesis
MNKIILLIGIHGDYIGGAQKRYLSLFNYISRQRKDYYLVINKKLYLSLKNNNVLKSCENVRVLTMYREKKLETFNIIEDPGLKKITENSKQKISGIRLFLGQRKTFLKSIMTWITFVFEFRKIIKELNCKVVYTIWTGGMYAWPLKKIYRFKVIHSYNDSLVQDISKEYWKSLDSEYYVLKYCDKIDFLSHGIINSLEKEIGKINPRRISVSPNSFINYERFLPHYPKENSVIFLSRLKEIKNPMLFLHAIKILNERKRDLSEIKFYIYGNGPLESDIINFINNYKLNNVIFGGLVFETWKYLCCSKVFMSIQDGNNYPSQALIEAMACENAIIASDVGETRLLVTENEGILVNLDAGDIAGAIEKLFTTPDLIEKLGKNARKKVIENHTIEKFADYFYSLTDS